MTTNTDLYKDLAKMATVHAESLGMREQWGYGFLNAMWPTIDAAVRAAARRAWANDEDRPHIHPHTGLPMYPHRPAEGEVT